MKFYTQNAINKPIKLMGFTSLQAAAVILILCFTPVICISILSLGLMPTMLVEFCVFIPIFIIKNKLEKEYKKGNHGYISSMIGFIYTPKKIIDKGIFKIIIND